MKRQYIFELVAGIHTLNITAENDVLEKRESEILATIASYQEAISILGGIASKLPPGSMGILGGTKISVPAIVRVDEEAHAKMLADIKIQQKDFSDKLNNQGYKNSLSELKSIKAQVPIPKEETVENPVEN